MAPGRVSAGAIVAELPWSGRSARFARLVRVAFAFGECPTGATLPSLPVWPLRKRLSVEPARPSKEQLVSPASLRRPASVRPGSFVPTIAVGERCALNCFSPRPPTCSGPATPASLVSRFRGGFVPAGTARPLRVCGLSRPQPVRCPRPCPRAALPSSSAGLFPGARPA